MLQSSPAAGIVEKVTNHPDIVGVRQLDT